jgi:hypothetical protein
MGAISIQAISKELMLACRQLGQVISETLAALVASTVINTTIGRYYVEGPIDENDARIVVEEAAKRILSKEEPGIASLRLQASYEHAFSEIERESQKTQGAVKAAEEKALGTISGFTAKFDQDFDTLTGLYKKIFQFLLMRCTSPLGLAAPPKNAEASEREVAAALESVFPRVGLRSFVALTSPEKTAQLQELAGIVLGIRLFNQHQNKGGAGLPTIDEAVKRLQPEELLSNVQKEVDELNTNCKAYVEVIVAARSPPSPGPWDRLPSESDIERARSDLLYHRQYLVYLLNLQEELAGSAERLHKDHANLNDELIDLDALIGGRVSVPKEQVYPRFDALSRVFATVWREVEALEAGAKLYTTLTELRKQYFPRLPEAAEELLTKVVKPDGTSLLDNDTGEEPVDLDAIPGPGGQDSGGAVRLTVENSSNFLQLPLDFQGFCVHTLVTQNRLLVPGNPALGVARYAGRYCVFATERGCAEFCAEPDRFFGSIREICYQNPELIHLLRIHEDFPKSSLHTIIQMTAGRQAVMQGDAGTETPLHFQDSYIDKKYEWNEWSMRRQALHMADIRQKSTHSTQTALSHFRRENESQISLPKDAATNTSVNRGTNPIRWKKYYTGLRGEPQAMTVVEVKFDL